MVVEVRNETVYVSGSLRSNQWPIIKTTAALLLEHYPLGVVIDFSGVLWVSATGESTLVSALDDIEQSGLPFVLVNLAPSIQILLTTSVSRRLAAVEEARRIAQIVRSELWWERLWGTA